MKNNYLGQRSELYNKLLEAEKIKDRYERFVECYEVIEDASYVEIHFIISAIKELEAIDESSVKLVLGEFTINVDIIAIIVSLLELLHKKKGYKAFLVDLLEEARERKRHQ